MKPPPVSEETLHALQQQMFEYFMKEANLANGLVLDKTQEGSPASIAVVGFALAAYPIGVERGFISRPEAAQRSLTTLRFFWNSPQGTEPDATGYKGFYYHFIDMETGRRVWKCELSTIDTAFLLAGMLTAATYFDSDSPQEEEIRNLADALYRRADWRWAQHGGATVSHGWTPENGFLKYRWEGYDEALILYALGLASPSYPLPEDSYPARCSTYEWKKIYDYEFLYGGPLFIHQFSHMWIDLREIQDDFMRAKGIDYFQNSRRAAYVQRQYAIDNPLEFDGYDECCWGITASDGPGPAVKKIRGIERRFYDYLARGVPYGPDDGTIAPWGVVASLPFAPEIILPVIRHFTEAYPEITGKYCFKCSFNPTFPEESQDKAGWISRYFYGLNLGPMVLMIENYRSEFLWRLMRRCPYVISGLRRAGFSGGWL